MFILHGNASQRPVLVLVDHKILMRPGTMDAYSPADTGIGRDLSLLFSFVEFFDIVLGRVIE